jgi:hypothetical protein
MFHKVSVWLKLRLVLLWFVSPRQQQVTTVSSRQAAVTRLRRWLETPRSVALAEDPAHAIHPIRCSPYHSGCAHRRVSSREKPRRSSLSDRWGPQQHDPREEALAEKVGISCRRWRHSSSLAGHWYVSNVSIIFDAPCLFLHHLPIVSLHLVALLCIFRN